MAPAGGMENIEPKPEFFVAIDLFSKATKIFRESSKRIQISISQKSC